MSGEQVVAIVGTGFGSSVFTAIVVQLFGRPKLRADTVEVIEQAAGRMVTKLESQVAERDTRVAELEDELRLVKRRLSDHDDMWHRVREQLTVHMGWDWRAVETLRAQGLNLPDPPALFPERRHPQAEDRR